MYMIISQQRNLPMTSTRSSMIMKMTTKMKTKPTMQLRSIGASIKEVSDHG